MALIPQDPTSDVAKKGIQSGSSVDAGLIAVVVSVLLATFAVCLFIVIRIRRQGGSWFNFSWNSPSDFVPVGLGAWIGRRPSTSSDEEQPQGLGSRRSISDRGTFVELDSETGPTLVETQRFEKPLGSKDNPAELEGSQDQRLSLRASWVSRMLSMVARSSTTTRSSSRSRWTQRSLAKSGDWETFLHGKTGKREKRDTWSEPGRGPPMLPDATYSRPITMSSDFPYDDDDIFNETRSSVGVAKVRSFDRLSEGTFGRVLVRRRSSVSSQNKKREAS